MADRPATPTDDADVLEEAVPAAPSTGPARHGYVAVACAAALMVVAILWGQALQRAGVGIQMVASPFTARWGVHWSPMLLVAAALAVVAVRWWVPAVERMAWRHVLLGAWAWALVWPSVLQLTTGWDSLYEILAHDLAYLGVARSIDSPADFLAHFVERIHDVPTHVAAHPPGAVLAHWLVDRLGGGRSDVLTATFLTVAASATPAALIAMDRVAGRAAARRAAPFVGLAPAAIWIATSPDAMFMGVAAWAVALGAVAVTSEGSAARVAAVCAGVLAGASLSLSYGSMLLLGPLWALAAMAVLRRRSGVLAWAVAGFAVIPVLFAAAGFNWVDGFLATRDHYRAGVASERPFSYFVFANVAVIAAVAGPAAVAGVVRLRHRAAWWLVGGALAGIAVANVSNMSKGEVERIWLPAVPFLLLACSVFPTRSERRAWVGVQLGLGIVMQLVIRSPW